jgi:hypothetical protein
MLLIGEGNGNLAYATVRNGVAGKKKERNKVPKDQQHPEPNRCRILNFIDMNKYSS